MVKITNGSRTTVVSKGAFKNYYEPYGWSIVDSEEEIVTSKDLPNEDEKTAEEANESLSEAPEEVLDEGEKEESPEDESDIEIPISEMTVAELREYAAKHDIDVSLAKNKKEMLAVITSEMGD